jgi:hypothetical protein|tara:strand:- start:280 stop:1266 length:987 start_codon:yes stop_codon:yes gene_type:complete
MADFKKEDRHKIKEKIKSKRLFITGSSRSSKSDTVLTSSFNEMSKSFANNDYLGPEGVITSGVGGLIYVINEMQGDIEDIHSEVSASVYTSQVSEYSNISTASIGLISSSLIPDKDDAYDLGASGKEWENLFIDGTANIDSLAMGTTVTTIRDEDDMSSNSATSLATQQSIKAYVDANAGGGSGNYDTGSHLVPHADNTYDLGSSTKEWKDLYVDGVAYIDSLAGTRLTAPIRTILTQVTSMKTSLLDAQQTDVFEFNSSKAFTVDLITPSFPGQEITIMNIGSGAVTITRSTKAKQTGIYGSGNITINQHQAYKFVVNSNQIWYVIS